MSRASVRRSYWIPGAYALTLSEKRNSFLRPWKNKGLREGEKQKSGYTLSVNIRPWNPTRASAVSPPKSSCDQDGHSGVQTPGAVGTSKAMPVRLVTAPRARAFQRVPFKAGEA